MENEAGSLHDAAVRAIVEGINRAKSFHQEYAITLRCSQCGEEATRVNAATQDAMVSTEEDVWTIPERPLDVTVNKSEQTLNLMIDASDRETLIDEDFLEELGLESFIKRINSPEDLEELGREFHADRGINTEDPCADCEEKQQT